MFLERGLGWHRIRTLEQLVVEKAQVPEDWASVGGGRCVRGLGSCRRQGRRAVHLRELGALRPGHQLSVVCPSSGGKKPKWFSWGSGNPEHPREAARTSGRDGALRE